MSDDNQQLLDQLVNSFGIHEPRVITTVEGYRFRPYESQPTRVVIEISDAGTEAPLRWSVVVTDENGRTATGNGANDLHEALRELHWQDLDADPGS